MNKKLRALIDRAERLIAEREAVNDAMKDLRAECKGQQYDAGQIMRLAQLSHDDKKRAKLAESNELLAVYNRESGLGLVLGLDDTTERTPVGTPATGREGPADLGKPPRPEPIPETPAGGPPPKCPTDSDPVAARVSSSRAVPAGAHKQSTTDDGIRPGSQEVADDDEVTIKEITLPASNIKAVGPEYPGERITPVITPDLARMTEAELVERAAAAKPAQPWRAA
jgi:uncharacterized protein (UPF0335 family)